MAIIKQVSLENTTEGHSKEYRLSLDDAGEVVALWGKIGANLTRTVKFSGDPDKAAKQYQKILNGQIVKGYVVVGEKDDGQTSETAGSQVAAGAVKQVIARVLPMLCEAIHEIEDCEKYILNDRYVLEEKYNGTRKEVIKGGDEISITNKKGQPTGKGMLPKTQKAFLAVDRNFTLDTEDEPVGCGCVILDILTLDGKPLDRLKRIDRRPILEQFYAEAGFDPKVVRLAEQAVGTTAKRAFIEKLIKAGAEGFIIKDNDSIYVGGEAGREHQWKHKFQATASFIVDTPRIGGKDSIAVCLLDGLHRVQCGKCTIATSKHIMPAKDAVVEIRYLYAERGSNKIVQAKFLGVRDDVDFKECKLSQLKYKQQTATNEAES